MWASAFPVVDDLATYWCCRTDWEFESLLRASTPPSWQVSRTTADIRISIRRCGSERTWIWSDRFVIVLWNALPTHSPRVEPLNLSIRADSWHNLCLSSTSVRDCGGLKVTSENCLSVRRVGVRVPPSAPVYPLHSCLQTKHSRIHLYLTRQSFFWRKHARSANFCVLRESIGTE